MEKTPTALVYQGGGCFFLSLRYVVNNSPTLLPFGDTLMPVPFLSMTLYFWTSAGWYVVPVSVSLLTAAVMMVTITGSFAVVFLDLVHTRCPRWLSIGSIAVLTAVAILAAWQIVSLAAWYLAH
jgi:hypothetical protein